MDQPFLGLGPDDKDAYLNLIGLARRLRLASWPGRHAVSASLGCDEATLGRLFESGLVAEGDDGTVRITGLIGKVSPYSA